MITSEEIKSGNIAATLLKLQERKTAKGNTYGLIKFTDLTSVFELFIFSDILELNRGLLIEGNSLVLTLSKNISDDENRFKRINVKKIAPLKDLLNKPISKVIFHITNTDQIKNISELIKKNGSTEINFKIKDKDNDLIFKLKNKRSVDRKSINLIKNRDISTIIH